MPASVKSSVLRPAHGDEYLTLTSQLGCIMHLSVPVSDPGARQKQIDDALALLDSKDAAMMDYAKAHGLPAPEAVSE